MSLKNILRCVAVVRDYRPCYMWKPLNLEIVCYLMFHDQVIEKGSYCNIITSMKDMATGNV